MIHGLEARATSRKARLEFQVPDQCQSVRNPSLASDSRSQMSWACFCAKRATRIVSCALLILASGCSFHCPEKGQFRVTRVLGPDRFEVKGGLKVRYVGVRSPSVGDPMYLEAVELNKMFVGGKVVRMRCGRRWLQSVDGKLRYVPDHSRYPTQPTVCHDDGTPRLDEDGYHPAIVWPPDMPLGDTVDFNCRIVLSGYARAAPDELIGWQRVRMLQAERRARDWEAGIRKDKER